jgi:hypothetical protein
MTMYFDGTSVASGSIANNFTETQSYIGRTVDSYYFKGYISNLRLVKGTALANTVPTSPLTAIANTSLLTCQSNRLIDNSPNSFAITKNGDVSVQAYSPFGSVSEATPLSYSNYFAGGASDYLTVTTGSSQLNLPSDFTVELWFYETNTTPTIPRFAGSTSGGFACGINAYDGNATRKLDWRATGSAPVYGVTAITTNVWHHAAYVKSGSTFRIFLDGVLEYYNGSYSTTFTSTATYIGSANSADAAYSFRGYISNFRVVKGTAVYTTASTTVGATIFTPGTSPLTAIANTALLTCQSTRIIDNSTNALTMTGTGTYTVNQVNPFGYTAQSATSYTPSIHGGSAYFDGTGDYLSTPDNTLFTIGSNDFTFECWVYSTSITAGNNNILAQWGNGNAWIFRYVAAGRPQFSGGATSVTGTTTAVVVNQWNHIAITRTSTTVRLFVNGILDATTGTVGALTDGASQVTIGAYSDGTSEYVTGYISDLRLINGTSLYTSNFIPPTQTIGNYSTSYPASLLLNFNNGGIVDQHSGVVLETVGNAQLSTAVKKYNNASMYFDGTGDGLLVPSSVNFDFGTGNFTIEMWINFTNVTSTWQAVISRAYYNSGGWRLYKNATDNQLRWYGSTTDLLLTTGSTLASGTWGHVAVVRNSGTLTIYIDGVNRGSNPDSTNYTPGNFAVEIGQGVVTSAYPVTGYIDDLRITKGYARYTSNFTPPTDAFITK